MSYTPAQVQAKIDANCPDNTAGYTTNALMRVILEYLKDMYQTAPNVQHTNNYVDGSHIGTIIDYLCSNNIPVWSSSKEYPAGFVVMFNGKMYRAISAVQDDEDDPQSETTLWSPIQPFFQIEEYNAAISYYEGQMVRYEDKIYIANTFAEFEGDPPDEPGVWDRIGLFDDDDINEMATIQDLVSKTDMTEVAISALDIDWSAGKYFTKTVTQDETFTFSNVVIGKTIIVEVTGSYDITWPAGKLVNGTRGEVLTTYYHVTCLKSEKYLIEIKVYL